MLDSRTSDLLSPSALPVLRRASNHELELLVQMLERSWDVRVTRDARYAQSSGKLTDIPELVDDYLRRAGGNSFCNFIRGGGPPYLRVLRAVCKKMGVSINEEDNVIVIEETLIRVISERIFNKLDISERKKIEAKMDTIMPHLQKEFMRHSSNLSSGPIILFIVIKNPILFLKLTSGLLSVISSSSLALLGTAGWLGVMSIIAAGLNALLGLFGLIVAGLWMAISFAGPSYRGLCPTILQICLMRQKMLVDENFTS
jgi:uncharacterized protein YaaW (UPF0174 family)